RTLSYARERKQANVSAKVTLPRACNPTATLTMFCSADISLPKMVRVRVAKYFRKCRVFHVARYGHYVGVRSSQPLQREAVGGAHSGGFGRDVRSNDFPASGRDRPSAAHFLNRKLFIRERLAVPVQFVGDQAEAVALD